MQWRLYKGEGNVSQNTLLVNPDYSKLFDIYMDASKHEIGGFVSQFNRPIAYFSCKFNLAQHK